MSDNFKYIYSVSKMFWYFYKKKKNTVKEKRFLHWHQDVGDSVLESNISTSQPLKLWLKGDWLREESYRLRMVCSKVLPPSAKGSLYVSPKPFPLSLHWPCVQTNQTTCLQRDQSQSVHLADPETPLSAKWQKKKPPNTLSCWHLAPWLIAETEHHIWFSVNKDSKQRVCSK